MKTFRRSSGYSLVLWALVFAGLTFAFFALPSIGIIVAPIVLAFAVIVAIKAHFWPEAPLGALIGLGIILILIALLHMDYQPCPAGPVTLGQGQTSFSCGGLDPAPLFIIGAVSVIIGASGVTLAMRRKAAIR